MLYKDELLIPIQPPNVQLALPVDVALIARQQIRRRLREWGKLLHSAACTALCALVKELADAELTADAAALRAEAARRERAAHEETLRVLYG